MWRVSIACWLPKSADTHPEFVIVIVSHFNNGCTSVPQRYVIRALPVLFDFIKPHRPISNDVAEHSISVYLV